MQRSEAPRIQSRLFSFAKQYRHASGFATPVEEGDETAVEFSRGATPFESGSLSEPLVPGGLRALMRRPVSALCSCFGNMQR